MTAVEQTPSSTGSSAFAEELQLRVAEAEAALDAAQSTDDPLLAQIAEADLEDLRGLAERNDVALPTRLVPADAG